MLRDEKVDAFKALYAFESETPQAKDDPFGVIVNFRDSPGSLHKQIETIPVLISEGFREMLSIDTREGHNKIAILQQDYQYDAQVVGLMEKTGSFAFTSRKIVKGAQAWEEAVLTSSKHYKMLLDDMIKNEPSIATKLSQLNA